MLNNIWNLSYSYSLSLIKIIDLNNDILIKHWINYLKFLKFILNKFYIKKYFLINKILFYNKLSIILKNNIFFNDDMKNFFYIIIEDNMIDYIDLIYKNFINIYKINKNVIDIFIYYKNSINKKNIVLIKKIFRNKISSNVNFIYLKKKYLIAGLKIKINDFVIDSSILNILNKIRLLNYKEYKNVF